MSEFLLSILAGLFLGLLVSNIAFHYFLGKKIKKACLRANIELYHELLLKKQNKTFQYSPAIRNVINRVHAALLVMHQHQLLQDNDETR